MKPLSVIAVVAILSGCVPEVVERVQTGDAKQSVDRVACHKHGYCYTTGMSYTGDVSPKFKMSPMCPGHQMALVEKTPMRAIYDNGSLRDYTQTEIIERRGVCK